MFRIRKHGIRQFVSVLGAGAAAVVSMATLAAMASARLHREITIPADTRFVGGLRSAITTENASVGDAVEIRTTERIRLDDGTLLPAAMVLRGHVTESKDGGRVTGRAELAMRFDRLLVDGREYPIVTDVFRLEGKSETKNSAKKAIGGAVVGGVVGAITGNTKRGILIGAAAGTGVAIATKGGHIVLPAGQRIQVRLDEPVTVDIRSTVADNGSGR